MWSLFTKAQDKPTHKKEKRCKINVSPILILLPMSEFKRSPLLPCRTSTHSQQLVSHLVLNSLELNLGGCSLGATLLLNLEHFVKGAD